MQGTCFVVICSCLMSKETSHGRRAAPCLCASPEARYEKNDHPPHITGVCWPPLALYDRRCCCCCFISHFVSKGFQVYGNWSGAGNGYVTIGKAKSLGNDEKEKRLARKTRLDQAKPRRPDKPGGGTVQAQVRMLSIFYF